MRLKNILFIASILLIAAAALSGCKGQGESGGNSSAFLNEESAVSSSEPQSTPEESSSEPQETSKTDGNHTHEYTETVTAPTCTADGYTLHKCSCGKTYKDNIVAKKGHTFGDWAVTKQATTAAEGQRQRVCTVCGAKETEKIAKLAVSYNKTAEQAEILRLVNAERAKAGLAGLTYREDLQWLADTRAKEITDSFEHERPDGTTVATKGTELMTDLQKNYNVRGIGENIAMGQPTPAAVMADWMNSVGHKENILRGEFTGIAVGIAEKNGVKYWVQIFVG